MKENIDEKIAHIKASSTTSAIISTKTALRKLLGCLILICLKTIKLRKL